MGTNYYWYKDPPCPTCGRKEEPLHIGKSSSGWCFALQIHPDKGINSLTDWQETWAVGTIQDEQGDIISPRTMVEFITERSRATAPWEGEHFFYRTEEELHQANSSERGPNNLLRYKLGGRFCVGHGEGPWDLIQGDFS